MFKHLFTPDGPPPREVNSDAVSYLDRALADAAGNKLDAVHHAIDPKRVVPLAAGGPPVWSVAVCPCSDGSALYVTYGLSKYVDPSVPFDFELSIRVRSQGDGGPGLWPVFLLRQLARYQLLAQREIEVGGHMCLWERITRAAMSADEKSGMPDTEMETVVVTQDPAMGAVRRVVGLYPDEEALAQSWDIKQFIGLVSARDPLLMTDIDRASLAGDEELRAAVEAGAARDGSSTGALGVPELDWEVDGRDINLIALARSD